MGCIQRFMSKALRSNNRLMGTMNKDEGLMKSVTWNEGKVVLY